MIFYFSGTGNTKYIADRLKKEIKTESIAIADIVREKLWDVNIKEMDKVGIFFPVYFYSIPTVVRTFLENVRFVGNELPYIYIATTCGATTGCALEEAEEILKQRHQEVKYKFAIPMPDNYVIKLKLPSEKEQERILSNSEGLIKELVTAVELCRVGDYNRYKGMFSKIKSSVSKRAYIKGRKTKGFHVDDKCTSCGLCEQICPTKTIALEDGIPKWKAKQCVHCLACINRCPNKAIQYGKGTYDRDRYVNPYCKF